jgi:hypothetical protein
MMPLVTHGSWMLGFLMRFIIWNPSHIWIIRKLLIVEIGDLGGYLLELGSLEVVMYACAIFQFVVEVWLIALKPK